MGSSACNYCSPWCGPKIKFHPLIFEVERHRLMLHMTLAGSLVRKKDTNLGTGTMKETTRGYKVCGDRLSALEVCSRCKGPKYCSVECQRHHWKNGHKKFCISNKGCSVDLRVMSIGRKISLNATITSARSKGSWQIAYDRM